MGNHIREGDLHDIRNDSIHVLIFRRPLQEMGWWRWKLYMKQIQRLATPCLYKWIFCWLLKWKTHLVFFIRANWRKMGIDWTSWDQIYGDIRCNLKEQLEREQMQTVGSNGIINIWAVGEFYYKHFRWTIFPPISSYSWRVIQCLLNPFHWLYKSNYINEYQE